ncbi:MAG: class I SAM-dependent methyltransferase [Lachnospiraceae bacterium]|nr:class I SAM-dependent methyltransferase [Lachnospiraceae bacterium]
MNAYTSFAQVYDAFMDNVPYEEGCQYLCRLLQQYGISNGLVAELGCGTGTLTELLAAVGYDMIGIDNSPDMLDIAQEKRSQSGQDILYLLQDMRDFELYGTVRSIISFCDSINYITNTEDLLQVFRLVNNYLDPNGYFIFDFHTQHYYSNILGESTIAEDREDMSFIWDNYYDEETCMNEYSLSIFVKEEGNSYRKFQEEHFQRAYTLEEIQALVEAAGLEYVTAYDELSTNPPTEESTRIHVVARERGKNPESNIKTK